MAARPVAGRAAVFLQTYGVEVIRAAEERPGAGTVAGYELDGDRYTLECLKTRAELDAFEGAWRQLERRCCELFIAFQTADWCLTWIRSNLHNTAKKPVEPHVFVLRKNGEAVLVWPTMKVRSRIGMRLLVSLTSPLSQYSNVIVDRASVPTKLTARALRDAIRFSKVDAAALDAIPDGSMLQSLTKKHGIPEIFHQESSILDLGKEEDMKSYLDALPKKTRRQRNQRRNKLTRMGKLDYRVHPGGSAEYKFLIGRALEMKNEWLQQTGRNAQTLSAPSTLRFLGQLSGDTNAPGQCAEGAVAHGLYLDDKPIAIEIGLCQGRHYYVYLGAFDWSYRKYSPGKVQMEYSQNWAHEAGVKIYDFLGEPADYKAHWTNSACRIQSSHVPVTLLGLAYCATWKSVLRPAMKSAFARLDPRYRRMLMGAVAAIAGRATGNERGIDKARNSAESLDT
ncbi:GNAT family N-acetyltransferase [Hoeflea poritis]|uniref:GNAT family N-acetyltransferase n=1 Tax=Hoeflea poritis TaxID=2993659 RepID=A0ABT4VTG6_9HYPH|nr:GNAT family N-acetyltransferase [Hoeflea poritis]MDA4847470.1 GNAT family N-acetyltransferase [Hoeflea poritis]